mgnify:CR=1 FL=1
MNIKIILMLSSVLLSGCTNDDEVEKINGRLDELERGLGEFVHIGRKPEVEIQILSSKNKKEDQYHYTYTFSGIASIKDEFPIDDLYLNISYSLQYDNLGGVSGEKQTALIKLIEGSNAFEISYRYPWTQPIEPKNPQLSIGETNWFLINEIHPIVKVK